MDVFAMKRFGAAEVNDTVQNDLADVVKWAVGASRTPSAWCFTQPVPAQRAENNRLRVT
jgi:hypothetical protein